jgi:heat shock protein HslJ
MRIKATTTTLWLLALLLVAGACGRGQASQAGTTKPDPNRPLQGTKWVVVMIVDRGAASPVPAGVEAYLTFEDGNRFGGNTGCNGMGGNSVVHEDRSTITFSEVITTKMACDDDRMRVERAVLDTLDGDVAYKVEADVLRLDGPGGHGLRLRATQPPRG